MAGNPHDLGSGMVNGDHGYIRGDTGDDTVTRTAKLHVVAVKGRVVAASARRAGDVVYFGVAVPQMAGVAGHTVCGECVAGCPGTVLVNDDQHQVVRAVVLERRGEIKRVPTHNEIVGALEAELGRVCGNPRCRSAQIRVHQVNLEVALLRNRRHLEGDGGDVGGAVHLGGEEYLLGVAVLIIRIGRK